MTSQLVLGNGFGMAVASDSAVTTGDRARTYEDAEKIHPLGDPHRLAVLQSGHVNLLGMPVGVLLKDWKNSLGTRQRTVEGYRDNFLTWLQDNLDKWTTSSKRDGEAWMALGAVLRDLWGDVQEAISSIPEEKQSEEVLRMLREEVEVLTGWKVIESELSLMSDEILDRLSLEGKDGRPSLSGLVDSWFGDFSSDEVTQEVHKFIRLLIGRSERFPNESQTFLAFVGYGANDLLPNLSGVWLYGAIGNHICQTPWPIIQAQPRGPSYAMIQPFGQKDMIELVLYGWDRSLLEDAAESTERQLIDPTHTPDGDDPGGDQGNAEDQYDAATPRESWRAALMDETKRLAWERRGERAFRTIASLPLSSLANAAGSLVSIQNLGQNIRGELPTVGGNINVATISLSEGFQWVSRQDDD